MSVPDTWQRGDPYERYIGRWSREVAPRFLDWLDIPAGRRWLDLGCGTGALATAILDRCAPTSVTGVEPSAGFLQKAREHLGARATLLQGDAASIPMPDAAVDVTASALMLNFAPDAPAALREMQRVTVHDGWIAAYVWDYAGRMDLMRHFWDAAVALDPAAQKLDEGARFPLCRPDALRDLLTAAGLRAVAATALDIPTRFASFDDYWQPFEGGQGPAPAYAMSLEPDARARLREHIRTELPTADDGAIALIARAWAVKGRVAR